MAQNLHRLIVVLGLTLSSVLLFAQSDNSNNNSGSGNNESGNGIIKNWYVGVNGGGTIMLATLREKPFSWAAGGVFGKQLNRKLGIQASFLLGQLHAEGLWGDQPFSSNVNFKDMSLIIKLNLNDFIFDDSPRLIREFYLMGGGGLTLFNTKVINRTDNSFVTGKGWDETGTIKTGDLMTPFVPLGIGMSYNLSKTGQYFLTSEFTYRYSQDNNMDGGLTVPSHPVHYVYTSLGFVYIIGKPSFSTQEITSDLIVNKVRNSVVGQVRNEMDSKIKEELKPILTELENHSKRIDENKVAIDYVKSDVESRINAINSSFIGGTATSRQADGSMQTTAINQMANGSIPTLTSIYFAFNSVYITPDMQRELAVIAKILKKNKALKCEVAGNASNIGSPEYNLILGTKRAEAVVALLVDEFGIDKSRLTVRSNGLADPLAKTLHNINRRVDMQLFW
ncbi:MAG: OmpA family protein [Bacteroidota bacterium]